jgi:hypothetical protein
MQFHLVCVNPFHGYEKGQMITDPAEVEKLMADREHHFVRIAAPVAEDASDGVTG